MTGLDIKAKPLDVIFSSFIHSVGSLAGYEGYNYNNDL